MNFQRDAFIGTLHSMVNSGIDLAFLSADFGAPSLDSFREELVENFFHLGISEQNMIDVSIGMALDGRTVFNYAMAPFISLRCAEQHKLAAMMQLPIINIIAGVGLGYANAGPTHYATEDLAIAYNMIGSEVYTTSDAKVASALAERLVKAPRFSFVRMDREPSEDIMCDWDIKDGYRELFYGSSNCIVTHGYCVKMIYDAIIKLGVQDEITLIDLIQCKPLPSGLISKLADKSNVTFVDEQIPGSSLGTFLLPELVEKLPKVKFKSYNLVEEFMFQNVGRQKLVELGGLSGVEIVESSIG